MMEPGKCSIPERRTDLADPADMRRRVLFIGVVLGGPAGALALLYGLTQGHPALAVVGGIGLALALVLWWRRGASLNATAAEIRRNPFKRNCEPKE